MGEQQSRRAASVELPRGLVLAKRRVVFCPTGRSTGCRPKQSSPYIRKVQHTVLSVAGLKGTMSEFELGLMRQRARQAFEQKVRRGFALWEVPVY